MPTRRTVIAVSAVALLVACKSEPKQTTPPPASPIKAQIDAGRAGARASDSAIAASQARMEAQAAEAAGTDTASKQP
jgi:type IV pilus biogenesis protein CpaD/CtpE